MFYFILSIPYTIFCYLIIGRLASETLKYPIKNCVNYSIVGFILTSIISLILNFFFPLSILTNSLISFFIISIFFIKKLKFSYKDYLFIFCSSCTTLLLLSYSTEYRPDAGLYHIPFTQILNENKIIFGLANIHSRFGHISILQYSAAINLNFLSKEMGILIPLACIASFIYLYFVKEIFKFIHEKKIISLNSWFCLIVLIFISYKINRYSEFGNDGTAHLFLFYLISMFLKKNETNLNNANFFYLLSVFAFLNKVFFIFVLIIPLYFAIKKPEIIKKITISFPTFILITWLLKNIFISGCVIYPIAKTCSSKLLWSDIQSAKNIHIEAEAWSKAWPENENKKISMEEFNKNFNWIDAWSKKHLKIILSILIPYIILILFLLIFLNFSKKNYHKIYFPLDKIILLSILCLLGSISFFLKYPIFRYGYSYLILLIFLTSLIIFKKINFEKFVKITKFFLTLSLIILISKQSLRIIKEHKNGEFLPYYIIKKNNLEKNYKKIELSKNFFVYYNQNLCFYGLSPCTNYPINTNNIKAVEKINYKVIYNEKRLQN